MRFVSQQTTGRGKVLGARIADIGFRRPKVRPVAGRFQAMASPCEVLVDGDPVSGALFDFGLFFFHNAGRLRQRGTGPYFYLPKLQSHLEARLWNDVFVAAQEALGVPRGSIRATVLIETLPAALEMDEILFELRDHSAGLNCGRWDYQFSYIKTFRNQPAHVLPDRAQVITEPVRLKAYLYRLSNHFWMGACQIAFRVDGTLVGTGTTDPGGHAYVDWVVPDGPAARAVGAWKVAVAAQEVELAASNPGATAGALRTLEAAVREAHADQPLRVPEDREELRLLGDGPILERPGAHAGAALRIHR